MHRKSLLLSATMAALGMPGVASSAALATAPCRVVRSAAPHSIYATLAQAVNASSPKETLTVNGVCEGDTTITPAVTPLTIRGAFGATLNGEHKEGSVLAVKQGVTVVASGLTITGGTGTKETLEPGVTFFVGGGVLNEGTLTLSNSYVTKNEITEGGGFGGGIENFGGILTLNNSIVSRNAATVDGGGIFDFMGSLTLNNSIASGNTATVSGGGIFDSTKTGAVTLNNSTVITNAAEYAGGIYAQEAALTLNYSSVVSNTAKAFGGGIISNGEATAVLNSSAVIGNRAEYAGGIGIGGPEERFPAGATVSLKGISTVVANTASAKEHGGGIYIENGGKLNLGVAIVRLNTPENIFQEP